MVDISKQTHDRGRPRLFDVEQALDLAIIVFREKGYYNASISDLSEGMKISSGSIYKAFQDKKNLFIKSFDRYVDLRKRSLQQRLSQEFTGRLAIAELLKFYLESAYSIEGRRGCLVVSSATELQPSDNEISELVTAALERNKHTIQHLVKIGQKDGSINPMHSSEVLSDVLVSMVLGLRVVGKIRDISASEQITLTILRILD